MGQLHSTGTAPYHAQPARAAAEDQLEVPGQHSDQVVAAQNKRWNLKSNSFDQAITFMPMAELHALSSTL
jgi:hypothetical protein